jgi:hypothetical protein
MPETNTPGAASENSPQSPVSTTAVETPASPQSAREAIYARHYGSDAAQTSPESTATESPAQGEQPVETAAAEPVALPPDPSERIGAVESQLAQIIDVLSKLTQPPPPVAAVSTTPNTPSPTWIDLLREGKVDEAEQLLATKLAKNFVPQAKSEATAEALELFRVETELTSYVTDLRGKNPDLLDFEDFIATTAKAQLDAMQIAGQIKSGDDYIKAYKNTVGSAVDKARKMVQKLRAAGTEEASIRNREVLKSSTITPNSVDTNRGTIQSKPEPIVETTEDYIAKRRASMSRGSGLAG